MKFGPIIILSLLGSFAACKPETSSVAKDELIGNQIVAALDKYKAGHGSYPDTLGALEPEYITNITPPRYGERRWDYIHYSKDDSFGLSMAGRHPTDNDYVYSSHRRTWEVAENSF